MIKRKIPQNMEKTSIMKTTSNKKKTWHRQNQAISTKQNLPNQLKRTTKPNPTNKTSTHQTNLPKLQNQDTKIKFLSQNVQIQPI